MSIERPERICVFLTSSEASSAVFPLVQKKLYFLFNLIRMNLGSPVRKLLGRILVDDFKLYHTDAY